MPPSWSVPREWKGGTAFIVAGGPSVTQDDVDKLKGRKVIAVNSSWQRAPWAEFLIFGDLRWWNEHQARVLAGFAGRIVFPSRHKLGGRILRVEKKPPPGLATVPTQLAMQRTTLSAAINLAAHLGASRIVLLGADMRAASDGRTHHHAPHKWPVKPGCWDEQRAELKTIVNQLRNLGVEVVNTSLVSRIDWWPKVPLSEVLAGLDRKVA